MKAKFESNLQVTRTVWRSIDKCTFASSVILATTRLSRVVSEDILYQFVGTLLELVDDSVVQGILVLLKPAGDIVRHLFEDISIVISI